MTGFPVAPKDAHVKAAAEATRCDVICTYDTDDFGDVEADVWSPMRLHKAIDPEHRMFEPYHLASAGTYMLLTRSWGGDEGRLLRDESGTAIWFRADGKIEAAGPGVLNWRSYERAPLGDALALIVRYDQERCEVAAWPLDGTYAQPQRTGTGSKLLLGAGRLQLSSTPTAGVIPYSEGFGGSSVPVWLKEHSILAGIANQTLEVAYGERSIAQLLSHLSLSMIDDGVAITWR